MFRRIVTVAAGAALVLAVVVGTGNAGFQSASRTSSVPKSSQGNVISGTIDFTTPVVNIRQASVRLSSADLQFFTISELKITVRYLNAGGTTLGAIDLPTAPSVITVPAFKSFTPYSAALSEPVTFNLSDVAGATKIQLLGGAILQNTDGIAHSVTLDLDVLVP